MNSQQLLFINFIIFVLIVLFFTLGRSKSKPPAKLNLKNSTPKEPSSSANESVLEAASDVREVGPQTPQPPVEAPKMVAPMPPPLALGANKAGRTHFVYNGHEWDAHEVLGLSRECSVKEATAHYQHLIKTSDPSVFEFYESAYFSILKSKK
ncbi:hypothetical protein [Pseudobdellovibrio exovorus]|uniref:hypothetical protein n=1 Tax=Pseudobdellovibrio exovorus TaxID=453816 RepID=UPI000344C8E4|nr:hypothetical protein [Pseudobdellovibrio exovorus]